MSTPASILEIWVLRHGQTEFNAQSRWQGWMDSPLTELGVAQTQKAAQRLDALNFDSVHCSPLGRARQTLEVCRSHLDLDLIPIHWDERIKERDVGVLSGHPTSEMATLFPEEIKQRLERPLEWHPQNGESSTQFITRVRAFWDQLPLLHTELPHRSLVVTHGGVCGQIHAHALGEALDYAWELKIPNCALSQYIWDGQKWNVGATDITLRDSSMTWFPS